MAAAAPLGSGSKRKPDYALADFHIVQDLGRGSFGVVTKVFHKETGETFAMKVMEKKKVVEHELQEQLKMEVLTHLKARHPNIVRMHYYFEDAIRVHCLLEFADKGNLFAYLRNFPKGLPEPKASQLFSDSAHGLAYLHGLAVAHRDVKPENILLFGEEPRAKLGDLGWCVALTVERPDRQTFCGTMDYLSPEMWLNEPHDTTVDLWALGVLLYEMVLARPPFAAKSAAEAMHLICAAKPKLPEGSMSEGARELVMGLLQREKGDRMLLNRVVRHPWVATFAGSCVGGGSGDAELARRDDASRGLDDTCVIRQPGGGGAAAATSERKLADSIEDTLDVWPRAHLDVSDEFSRVRAGGSPPREERGLERQGELHELRDFNRLSVVDNPSVPAEDLQRLSMGLRPAPLEGSSARAPSPRSVRPVLSEDSSARASSRRVEGVRMWEDVHEPEQLQPRWRVDDAGPSHLLQQRQWAPNHPHHHQVPNVHERQGHFERPRQHGAQREYSRGWEQWRPADAVEGVREREKWRRATEHAEVRPGELDRRRRSTLPPEVWRERGNRLANVELPGHELPAHGRGAGVCFPGPRRKAPPPREELPEPSDEDEVEGTLTSAGTLVYEFFSGFFASPEPQQHRQRAKLNNGGFGV